MEGDWLYNLVGGLVAIFYFPIYWECHHPNWLPYFSEGWPNHQPVLLGQIKDGTTLWYSDTGKSDQIIPRVVKTTRGCHMFFGGAPKVAMGPNGEIRKDHPWAPLGDNHGSTSGLCQNMAWNSGEIQWLYSFSKATGRNRMVYFMETATRIADKWGTPHFSDGCCLKYRTSSDRSEEVWQLCADHQQLPDGLLWYASHRVPRIWGKKGKVWLRSRIVCWLISLQGSLQLKLQIEYLYMEVTWNGGTPKSSILIGFSLINHPF